MSNVLRSAFSGAVSGVIAKIVDAILKFISIPFLIGFYGKADYGLIALAFSLNAYLRLMEMGMNTGAIRFYSIWFKQNEVKKIIDVTQSSIIFYGMIGVINAIVYLLLGVFGRSLFNVSIEQSEVFTWMMYILSGSAVFQWVSYVYVQLLTANEDFKILNAINVLRSILNFSVIIFSISLKVELKYYYILFMLSNLCVIPLYIIGAGRSKLSILTILIPKWNYAVFKEVLRYSASIFVMSLFQFTANEFRPILLSAFSGEGVAVLSDYRIVQTIVSLVVLIGGVFMQVLLPIASKGIEDKSSDLKSGLAYEGTKYVSIFLSLVVFGLILNSERLLNLYVGIEFLHLTKWLVIWLITTMLYLHNAPIASIVLASGRIKPLIYVSAIGCFISLIITSMLAPFYNIGAAVIGYFVYIVLQMFFYYLYYIPKVLVLDSSRILLKSFMAPFLVGASICLILYWGNNYLNITNTIINMIISSLLFLTLYSCVIVLAVLRRGELKRVVQKLK